MSVKESIGRLSAEELANQKLRFEQRTMLLTQHVRARTNSTARVVSNASGSAYLFYLKFKIYLQHLASYPKIVYLPLMLFSCGIYGYHSVKTSSVPYNPSDHRSNTVENPFENLSSFKRWLISGVTGVAVDIVGS